MRKIQTSDKVMLNEQENLSKVRKIETTQGRRESQEATLSSLIIKLQQTEKRAASALRHSIPR